MLVNSAGVLLAGELVDDIRQGVQRSAELIDNGSALGKLDHLVELSQSLGA